MYGSLRRLLGLATNIYCLLCGPSKSSDNLRNNLPIVSTDTSLGKTRGSLRVESVSKRRGSVAVLDDVSLDVRPGEFVTLLGPSGCGKTTLLRQIAGLDEVDAGRISISGSDVTAMKAHLRPVHTVFQSYALFPHLSVFENVAFGLRIRGRPADEIQSRVSKVLSAVHLEGFDSRAPSEISGGQGQRVALARALVLEPDILLLDEPLAALDAQLRSAMRGELVLLQRLLGITFVLVTHDLEEAIECSSRIAVMRGGRIAQYAAPEEIFERPTSVYVAGLVGMENILEGRVMGRSATGTRVDLGFTEIEIPVAPSGPKVKIGLHGEHIAVAPDEGGLSGTLIDVRYLGEAIRCHIRVGEATLVANVSPRDPVRTGDRVSLVIPPTSWIPLSE
ncbi:MAG: ABC transporter ATP-binding protein [Vicinamibacteria bacterium]|nr:ABC transporter ATP-binding protein [Vicinamibacteria bacterium]